MFDCVNLFGLFCNLGVRTGCSSPSLPVVLTGFTGTALVLLYHLLILQLLCSYLPSAVTS